ncbi:MAG: hypothetical protein ACYDDF_15095 [Thermoplasmatota archaeon]
MSEAEPMDRMNFTVPSSVKRQARARKDVNWSAVVTKAIQDKLHALEVLDHFAAKANLSQRDADEIADLLDEAMARRGKKARS